MCFVAVSCLTSFVKDPKDRGVSVTGSLCFRAWLPGESPSSNSRLSFISLTLVSTYERDRVILVFSYLPFFTQYSVLHFHLRETDALERNGRHYRRRTEVDANAGLQEGARGGGQTLEKARQGNSPRSSGRNVALCTP